MYKPIEVRCLKCGAEPNVPCTYLRDTPRHKTGELMETHVHISRVTLVKEGQACPYRSDVWNDPRPHCFCDEEQQRECADDI